MRSFDEFMPDLEPELPLCPIPVIERRLREAAIEACEDAAVWRFEHPEIQIKAGQQEYVFEPPPKTDVHSILSVSRGQTELDPTRHVQVDRRGFIALHTIPNRDSAELDSTATANRGLFVCVSLKPTRDALEVSDEIYRDYYKMLIAGTLAKAYAMAGQPWSNDDMAFKYRAIFEKEIASARRARERGYVSGNHRMRPSMYSAPLRRGR